MTNLLLAKPLVAQIKEDLIQKVQTLGLSGKYIAIIHVGENKSSQAYVSMKKKFGESIGIAVKIIGQDDEQQLTTAEEVVTTIQRLNQESDCIGIMTQLPLPDALFPDTNRINAMIDPYKDIDGLGGQVTGLAQLGLFDFLPATAESVMSLLHFYDCGDMEGKTVAVIGQSNLLGKPLAVHLMNLGATVYAFNGSSDQEEMKKLCQQSDYIISSTGVVHLVNQDFVRDDQSQILVDVGYGYKDGKAVGDIDFATVVDRVKSITPVPGGVGPATVANLFANTVKLYQLSKK